MKRMTSNFAFKMKTETNENVFRTFNFGNGSGERISAPDFFL